jgi:hypothetical protein
MILISHRGNLRGRMPSQENHPEYVLKALEFGFDVEVDFWAMDGVLSLGHDHPEWEVDTNFIVQDGLWLHAKNYEALQYGIDKDLNVFWHNTDSVTLTNHGWIWAYPGVVCEGSIAVLPETQESGIQNLILDMCGGICSDKIEEYKNGKWNI